MSKEILSTENIGEIQTRLAQDGYAWVKRTFDIGGRAYDDKKEKEEDEEEEDKDKEEDEEKGFPVVISDESEDSHGTVFKNEGWDLKEYNDNPIVTWQHPWLDEENPDMFIGTGTAVSQNRKIVSDFVWEPGDTNDIVRKLKNKVKSGMIRSASIVARVEDGRYGIKEKGENPDVFYFIRQKLVTYGIVAFPSNKGAKIQKAETVQKSISTKDTDRSKILRILTKANIGK